MVDVEQSGEKGIGLGTRHCVQGVKVMAATKNCRIVVAIPIRGEQRSR